MEHRYKENEKISCVFPIHNIKKPANAGFVPDQTRQYWNP